MKRSIVLLVFISLAFLPVLLRAQCNQYYDIHEGSEWEMGTYNAKGKLTGKKSAAGYCFRKKMLRGLRQLSTALSLTKRERN